MRNCVWLCLVTSLIDLGCFVVVIVVAVVVVAKTKNLWLLIKLNLIHHFNEHTHTSSQLFIVTLDQGCTTQFSWRAKFEGQNWYVSYFKGCFHDRNKLNKQNFGIWGTVLKIWGPHLARAPYVFHAHIRLINHYITN